MLAAVCALWFGSLWGLVRLAEMGAGERILAGVADPEVELTRHTEVVS